MKVLDPDLVPAASGSRLSKIYYGWWVVLAASVAMFIQAGVGFYSFSLFYNPLENEFHWSRASISVANAISVIGSAFLGPFVGSWTDKRGARGLMIVGAVSMALALVSVSFVNSLWQLYLVFGLMAIGRAGLNFVPASATIARWFVEKRGMAIGLAAAGIGIGGLVIVPVANLMIDNWTWRGALIGLAVICCVVVVPPVYFLFKASPSDMGLRPYGEDKPADLRQTKPARISRQSSSEHRWTLGELFRNATFWLTVVSLSLIFFCQGAILLHTVPLLRGRAMDGETAAWVLSIASGAGSIGKIGFGILADRIAAKYVLLFCALMQIAGVFILLHAGTSSAIWAYAVVFGIGMGGVVAVQSLLIGESFGLISFGLVLGAVQVFAMSINSLGPVFAGWIYDTTKTYDFALYTFVAAYVISAVTVMLVRPCRVEEAPIGPAIEGEIEPA